jgi:hypothetical protein
VSAKHSDSGLGTRRKSILAVTLIAAVFWASVLAFVAAVRYGGDIRGLLCAGEEAYLPAAFETVPRAGPTGYDGQQYAALATDPLLRDPETVQALDAPHYRATRILVPLLAWALALGHAAPAIVAYQLLCWGLALGALFLTARWLGSEGHSPWWALPLVGSAGMVAAMIRSTPDAAALCLLLAALFLHGRGRPGLALVASAAAILARETSYLAVLAITADELRRRRFPRAAAFAIVPLVPFLAWQLYLTGRLGASSAFGSIAFTTPFAWLPEKLPHVFTAAGVSWQELFGLAAVAATTLGFLLIASRPAEWRAPELAFLAFATLGLVLTYDAYVETWGYGRILIALPFLGTLLAERQSSRGRRWSLRAIAVLYLLAGATMLRWEVAEATNGRTLIAALRATVTSGARGRPEGGAQTTIHPLYVVPVANALGRAGARWQTWLELTNLSAGENRVLVDLLPTGRSSFSSLRAAVDLAPGQKLTWRNALNQIFGFSGSGALRLTPLAGPVAAASRTANVAAGGAPAPLLPALGEDRAFRTGESAVLHGLFYEPSPAAAVRTNIGILNLSRRQILVRITAFDSAARRRGDLDVKVPHRGFIQVDDVFAKVHSGPVAGGSAVVEAATPEAGFLAYASVIRGPDAPVVYIFPAADRRPASVPE